MTTVPVSVDLTSDEDRELWHDAWRMAWVGASNPVACAGALTKHSKRLMERHGTNGVRQHPALQAIAGHLAYLYGQGLGPDSEVLDCLAINAKAMGLINADETVAE